MDRLRPTTQVDVDRIPGRRLTDREALLEREERLKGLKGQTGAMVLVRAREDEGKK